jgi:serine/threonine-protein kinase
VQAGRRVALKRLYPHLAADEDFVRMFVDEVQLLSRFTHPHILGLLDIDDEGETYFAVLELVDGPSLSAALRLTPPRALPPPVAVAVATAVADALVAVHGLADERTGAPLALVHRDVNPMNVLVGRDGAVKLADFGVAHSTALRVSGVLKTKETTAGTRKGKASYLAPEQIVGRAVDARADLYALGATLWALLTGQPPFVAERDVDLFGVVQHAPAPRLLDRAAFAHEHELGELIAALLEKDPAARPERAAVVRDALDGWLRSRAIDGPAAVAGFVRGLGLPSLT